MKNNQSAQKPNNRLINLLIQLLNWLTDLELSEGDIVDLDIGPGKPEWSLIDSIYGNNKYNNQTINKCKMEPHNLLVQLILQLHHWLSHLELSGGFIGEQEIGPLLSMPAYTDSI